MSEDNIDFQAEFPEQNRNPAQVASGFNAKGTQGTVKAPAVVPVIQ